MTERLYIALLGICAAAVGVEACGPTSEPSKDMETYGLVIQAKSITVKGNERELGYEAYFNRHKSLKEVKTYNRDGSFRNIESFFYDKKGKLVESIEINADNETEARWVTEYDGDFVSSRICYGMNNNDLHNSSFENDGEHITACDYYYDGSFRSRTEFEYHGDSLKIENDYDADGKLYAIVNHRMESGKTVHILTVFGEDDTDITIRYDSNGLPIYARNVTFNSKGEFLYDEQMINGLNERWFEYDFDDKGNWIERRESIEPRGESICTTRRVIEY